MNQDERHYNSKKMQVIFAVSAMLLFASVLWMTYDDFSRPYKAYQAEFQEYEIVKTRVKYDALEKQLSGDAEYQQLKEQTSQAQETFEQKCPDHVATQRNIEGLQTTFGIVEQQYKFAKAELDASKYRLEEAAAHHLGTAEKLRDEYAKLTQRVEQLKLETEQAQQNIQMQQSRLGECQAQIKELEKKSRQVSSRADLVERKLANIDPDAMNFTNRVAQMVRNLPILDLADPTFEVKQVVISDIRDDVNFMTVPKVDRCITCHLGIDNPDYKDADQPFRTHPNLEEFVDKDSAHPLEEFGCTVCHGGRGRATDFIGAAHNPNSPQQEEEWKKKYDWKRFELWEDPMVPMKFVESGCFKCHTGNFPIKGADQLNLGLQIIETAGCYACHQIDRYSDWQKPGPNLQNIKGKLTKEWAYKWVRAPHSFRPDTWMPAFFGQSNNDSPEDLRRSEQEVLAMVHYLFEKSADYSVAPMAAKGDAKRGEEMVKSVGCFACHTIETPEQSKDMELSANRLRQEFGPNLFGLGSKTTKEWIYNWVKDPKSYHAKTRMPDFRLSDQEAADIAEFLHQSQNPEFDNQTTARLDPALLDEIVFTHLRSSQTADQAKGKLGAMTQDEKLVFAGEKLINHYGCYSCHDISGFENAKPVGTELTEENSKDIHKFDFGFVHIDHTKWTWFDQKLKDPRIFDHDKIKTPEEKLKMPNFHFTQAETDAVVTALLGFVEQDRIKRAMPEKSSELEYIEEGQELVRQFNCKSCHIIENEGGAIRGSVKDWIMTTQDKSEAEADAMITSFAPPNLLGEGKKVKSEWLFEFIHRPTAIRPWLKLRMPTYHFDTEQVNTLVKYFNALDQTHFPFVEDAKIDMTAEQLETAHKLFSNEYFGCAQCHIVGDQMPGGSPDSWAPNFALDKSRLRPEWILEWIKNPQALLPGTKMPTYFDPENFGSSGPEDILNGDENKQILYLRNYLMTLSAPASGGAKAAPSQESAPTPATPAQ